MQSREKAREQGDWKKADELRERILLLGWQVNDTRDGPQLTPRDA
jgi:cysteinyl-tRNA synthetase